MHPLEAGAPLGRTQARARPSPARRMLAHGSPALARHARAPAPRERSASADGRTPPHLSAGRRCSKQHRSTKAEHRASGWGPVSSQPLAAAGGAQAVAGAPPSAPAQAGESSSRTGESGVTPGSPSSPESSSPQESPSTEEAPLNRRSAVHGRSARERRRRRHDGRFTVSLLCPVELLEPAARGQRSNRSKLAGAGSRNSTPRYRASCRPGPGRGSTPRPTACRSTRWAQARRPCR